MVAAEWQVNDNMILVSLPKARLALLGQTHIRSYLADSRCPIFNVQLYDCQFYQGPHYPKDDDDQS